MGGRSRGLCQRVMGSCRRTGITIVERQKPPSFSYERDVPGDIPISKRVCYSRVGRRKTSAPGPVGPGGWQGRDREYTGRNRQGVMRENKTTGTGRQSASVPLALR